MFNPNSALMYCMTAIVIAFVIAMSIRFIVMAWKRAKKIGMDPKMLRRVAVSSAIFTIAPAVSILLGVIALSRALGFPLPWLRLSVIGALTYETPAAASAASAGRPEVFGSAMICRLLHWALSPARHPRRDSRETPGCWGCWCPAPCNGC